MTSLIFYQVLFVYSDCKPSEPSRHGKDAKRAERLWQESMKLVGWDPSLSLEQIIDGVENGELK